MTSEGSHAPTFGVVGGGIVGLAVAARLAADVPGAVVTVWEKEREIGQHQTGHNSGVAHSGLYYAPGSLKAQLCRAGVTELKEYCTSRSLAYDEIGKIVVARDELEVTRLQELHRRGTENGVPGLEWLSAQEIGQREPGVRGVAGLFSPTTAIVDYAEVVQSLARDVVRSGGRVHTSSMVRGISRVAGGVRVDAGPKSAEVERLVVCAGLQSDTVAQLAGDSADPQIIAFRGEYLRLRPHARERVRHLIYPVPDPRYPFLGVHVTPRVCGEVDLGPNAVLALAREGYARSQVSPSELTRLASSPGMRHLARAHWRAGLRELRGSVWRRAFLDEVRTYLPWIENRDVMAAPAGVRAQAVDPDGTLVDDFRFGGGDGVLTVRNAPSPAATSSLAIARHVVTRLNDLKLSGR